MTPDGNEKSKWMKMYLHQMLFEKKLKWKDKRETEDAADNAAAQ